MEMRDINMTEEEYLKAQFEQVERKYSNLENSHQDMKKHFERIKKYLDGKNSFLDVGCFDGYMLDLVGCKYKVGIDINEKNVEESNKKGYLVIEGDIRKDIHFYTNFDFINLKDTLEHIPREKQKDFLNNIERYLTDNGVMYIVVPVEDKEPTHKHPGLFKSINELKELVSERYEIIEEFYIEDDKDYCCFLKKKVKTLFAFVRTIGEKTIDKCIKSLQKKGFNYDYMVIKDFKPLAKATKEVIKISGEIKDSYRWTVVFDADMIVNLNRYELEYYCWEMEDILRGRFQDKYFMFTGYVDCTKRGIVDSIHFYRTKYCEEIYNFIKDKEYNKRVGKDESEICIDVIENLKLGWSTGYKKIPMAKHIYEAQISERHQEERNY